ncbi:MAG: hypothetical protein ACYCUV_09495 [Phycisphaerae bacterium]
MLNSRHLLKAAAIACMFLGTGSILAAGTGANRTATDAKLLADIPSTAQAVVIIHDMAALDKKVAMLAQKLKIPVLPPSLRHIEKTLNLTRGITAHGTAAIVMIPDGSAVGSAHSVMILPAKDPASAIANMNFSTGKDGLAHGQSADGRDVYAMAGKGFIMVSNHQQALLQFKSVSTAITPMLTASEQPLADNSDVYILLNVPAIRKPLEKAMAKTDSSDATSKATNGAELKTIAKKVGIRMAKDTHSALIGLRISSAAMTLSMISDEKAGSPTAQALSCLRPLTANPLMGLPDSTSLIEAAASNIDGALAAKILDQWAVGLSATASDSQAGKNTLSDAVRELARWIRPMSQCSSLLNVASKATGPVMPSIGLANSQTPAASAAGLQALLVNEGRWLTSFQLSMGTKVHYHTTVSPEKVVIASIPFASIKQAMVLPAAGTPRGDAIRSAMKMQQALLGMNTESYLIGSNDKQLIVGGNCSHNLIAETVKASASGTDALDSNAEIMAAAKHTLDGPCLISYLNLSPFIGAMAQRVQAMANMNAPILKMPATEPMSMSVAVKNNTLTGQWRMPMKNLEQLSMRIHALLPLVMMMEMQSMQGNQAGQGGAGQPQ